MGNLCSLGDSNELREDGGRFIIHFISATDVPKADLTSESDPYLKAYVIEGKMKSKIYKSLVRDDNRNPIWDSYHDFRLAYNVEACLKVEVWDADVYNKDTLVGDVTIPLHELQDEKVKSYPLHHKIGSSATNPNFSVNLQRVYMDSPPPMRKTIFLVRHGQSKWNEAQNDGKYLNLLDIDHALSSEGVQQAERLNTRWKDTLASTRKSEILGRQSRSSSLRRVTFLLPDENATNQQLVFHGGTESQRDQPLPEISREDYEFIFQGAQQIYSSPLTRALQTTLIALQHHPVIEQKGVILYSQIREAKKTVGGLDCIGLAVDQEIKTRAFDSLISLVGNERALDICKTVIHVNDCSMPWWTGKLRSETDANIASRINEFLKHIQYSSGDTAIYVGHSLFFRQFCSHIVGPVIRNKKPELGENMAKFKLANSSMLALTIVFPDGHLKQGFVKPFVEDACLMFGSSFDTTATEDNNNTGKRVQDNTQVEVEMVGMVSSENNL